MGIRELVKKKKKKELVKVKSNLCIPHASEFYFSVKHTHTHTKLETPVHEQQDTLMRMLIVVTNNSFPK